MNDEHLALLIEDPDRLDEAAWSAALAAVRSDPHRLREQLALDERLSRILDPGRADLLAAVRQRLHHAGSGRRFARRVVERSHPRRRWPLALAAGLALLAGLAAWLARTEAPPIGSGGSMVFAGGRVEVGLGGAWRSGAVPRLEAGRAVLDVREPCAIAVPGGRVRVLGTRFSLHVQDGGTLVAVERGRVSVEGTETLVVEAGQQVRVAADGGVAERLERQLAFVPADAVARRGDFYTWDTPLADGPDGPELASFVAAGHGWTGVRICPRRAHAGRPDLAFVLRYRLLRDRPGVQLQVMNREQGVNFRLSRSLPGTADAWHDVAVPLAELVAVPPATGVWRPGEVASEVLLFVDGEHGDVLRLGDASLALPAPGR